MTITDDEAAEFARRYARAFGEDLPIPEAREIASNLCELYLMLLSPTPSEQKVMDDKASHEVLLTPPSSQAPDTHPPAP